MSTSSMKLRWSINRGIEIEFSPDLAEKVVYRKALLKRIRGLTTAKQQNAVSKRTKKVRNTLYRPKLNLKKARPTAMKNVISRATGQKLLQRSANYMFPMRVFKKDIGSMVVRAIKRLADNRGSSVKDIKRYLSRECGLNVEAHSREIIAFFRHAVKCGLMVGHEGKYKMVVNKRKPKRSERMKKPSRLMKKRGEKSIKRPKRMKKSSRLIKKREGKSIKRSKRMKKPSRLMKKRGGKSIKKKVNRKPTRRQKNLTVKRR